MDTVISLTIYGEAAEKHVQQAADMLREMEASLSVTREDSEIAQLNASGSGEVSDETALLFAARAGTGG